MKLNYKELVNQSAWKKNGIKVPSYDVAKVTENAIKNPGWVHFGIGNIFRVFIGGIVDGLLEQGLMDKGITCVETFDYDVVDKIYAPFDNLALSVILKGDGTRENKVLGSLSEAVKAQSSDVDNWKRLKEIFTSDSLQIVSFTITEKGYALKNAAGDYLGYVVSDIENGPDAVIGAMGVVTSMLLERFKAGARPLALVSMDNCSHNGDLLRQSVVEMAEKWVEKGYVGEDFIAYVSDQSKVSFPWTMIDKITPRPSTEIANDLEALGVENMQPVVTGKRTYIAPFINAEKPQYLVIEDSFPNGRPELEKGFGVYMADRETVNKAERMKVTACLNPVHSALGPFGVVWGVDLFAELLEDPAIMKMGRQVAYTEGMPVIEDPKIIDPRAFADELFEDRFINKYLGDTNIRLCTDESQGVGVRFGETTKAYVARYGTAEQLVAIPLGIAGWLRYLYGVDDNGNAYELAPDPLAAEIHEQLSTIKYGDPASVTDQLRPILSNENIFFTDMYKAGLGEKIEGYFREMIEGPGSCKKTVYKYMD
ncbi:MAG: mannitol dehydrogenase family protein [Eubacteriales bacterium]|nr:mannitol dehydrogenase family protein [Eubacteriales bacterium]